MKNYTFPSVLVLAASGLMLFATAKTAAKASRASAALATERQSLAASKQTLMATQRRARAAAVQSQATDRFLELWQPEMDGASSIEQIFGQLDTLAVGNLLSPSGKTFTSKINYFFNRRQFPVQTINITVAGDFYRTVNWLGAVENAFPLARVEQISYAGGQNSLTLAVQLVFPRKFEAE
jgi:hypothetical protein